MMDRKYRPNYPIHPKSIIIFRATDISLAPLNSKNSQISEQGILNTTESPP